MNIWKSKTGSADRYGVLSETCPITQFPLRRDMNLPLISVIFGIALDILAAMGFFLSESKSVTAWIPSFIGVPMMLAGFLGFAPNRQKIAMRIATGFGVLGLLASAGRLAGVITKGGFEWKLGTFSLVAMALICGIYLILCVQYFRAARVTNA